MAEFAWRYVRRLGRMVRATLAPSEFVARELEREGVERVVRVGLGVDLDRFHPRRRAAAAATRRRLRAAGGSARHLRRPPRRREGSGPAALRVARGAAAHRRRPRARRRRPGPPPAPAPEPAAIGCTGSRSSRIATRWPTCWPRWTSTSRPARSRPSDSRRSKRWRAAPRSCRPTGAASPRRSAAPAPATCSPPATRSPWPTRRSDCFRGDLATLGAAGRRYAEADHGWDAVLDRIFDVYRGILRS